LVILNNENNITLTKFNTIIGAPNLFINCLKCLAATIANGSTASIFIGGFGTCLGS